MSEPPHRRRGAAALGDELRPRVSRLLGALLAAAGAGLIALQAGRLDDWSVLTLLLVMPYIGIAVTPCGLGALVWLWPRSRLVLAFVWLAVAAAVVPIVAGKIETLLKLIGRAGWENVLLGRVPLGELGVETANVASRLAAPVFAVVALSLAIDQVGRTRARWAWVAAGAWVLPIAAAVWESSWRQSRWGVQWWEATEWRVQSVRLFAFGCAACVAWLVAVEREAAHRRWLALVGSVVLVGAEVLRGMSRWSWRFDPNEAVRNACWIPAMAIALVPLIIAPAVPLDSAEGGAGPVENA